MSETGIVTSKHNIWFGLVNPQRRNVSSAARCYQLTLRTFRGGGSLDTITYRLTLRTFRGGGQSGYSNFFLYLAVLGGGELKKTPCTIIFKNKQNQNILLQEVC